MFKKLSFLVLLLVFTLVSYSFAQAANNNGIVISNSYFSFTVPNEMKGIYTVLKEGNAIYICEKVSEKAGLGGGAFGLNIYRNPKDYADMSAVKKIGELTDKNGKIYDMVISRPVEIEYADDEKVAENYKRLYDFGEKVEIKGVNGSKYVKNKGMKGEELYGEILKKYKKALTEKWDSKKYEQEGMGYMYYVMSKSNENLQDKIGYIYYDINSDGIDELLIGETDNKNSKIYDIYTMVNRKPTHVTSGGDKDMYFVCNDNFLCNAYVENSKENTFIVYYMDKNSNELNPQITFIYSKNENKKNPRFVGYGSYGKLENVSRKVFNERKNWYKDYNTLDYIPFSTLK